MKKLLFVLVAFLFIANFTAYAFDFKYFSVSDRGWKVNKKSDNEVSFSLPIIIPTPELVSVNRPSNIFIDVKITGTEDDDKDEKTYYYVEYNQKDLEDWEKICRNIFQGLLKSQQEFLLKAFKEDYPNYTEEERKAAADEVIKKGSKIEKIYFGEIGKHKAQIFEYKAGGDNHKLYRVITLNRMNFISITYPESISLDDYNPCKEFVKTFEAKDKEATKFNSYLHAYGWWIFFIVLVVLEIFFKLKRNTMKKTDYC